MNTTIKPSSFFHLPKYYYEPESSIPAHLLPSQMLRDATNLIICADNWNNRGFNSAYCRNENDLVGAVTLHEGMCAALQQVADKWDQYKYTGKHTRRQLAAAFHTAREYLAVLTPEDLSLAKNIGYWFPRPYLMSPSIRLMWLTTPHTDVNKKHIEDAIECDRNQQARILMLTMAATIAESEGN